MLFSLLHAFLLFTCVVLLVRLTLPARYVLLNPYAAMLDNLLTRGLAKLQPAFPLPTKALCGLVLVLFLCADAVMLSRLQLNLVNTGALAVFTLPSTTFVHWLWIAIYGLARHLLTLLTAVLFFSVWHRTRQLPGYSGDLLRLSVCPVVRLPVFVQLVVLCVGATVLAASLFLTSTEVAYNFEQQVMRQDALSGLFLYFSLSTLQFPFQLLALAIAMIFEIFSELFGFTLTLTFVALLSSFSRSQGLTHFIDDLFRLLRGPLPEVRLGVINLTPLLLLAIFILLSSITQTLGLFLVNRLAMLVGAYVV